MKSRCAARPSTWLARLVILLASAGAGYANPVSVTVACPSQSINTQLALLNPADQNTVTITGNCTESVVVTGFSNLTLQGPAGLNQPPNGTALHIRKSDGVIVKDVTFEGSASATGMPALVVVASSTGVGFNNCTFLNSAGAGLQIDSSTAGLNGGMILQSAGQGMVISGPSSVSLSGWDPNAPVYVLNNGTKNTGDGISVGQGGSLMMGPYVQVVGSSGNGITLTGGSVVGCCGSATGSGGNMPAGPTIAANKGWGIYAGSHSLVTLVGATSGQPAVIVSNNTAGGIWAMDSEAGLYWGVTVGYNGDSSQQNPFGGVQVSNNGVLIALGGSISDNYGPGILASQGAAVTVGNGETITGNSGSGVYVQLNASAEFTDSTNNITGNTPADLTCVAAGVAAVDQGQTGGIGNRKPCQNFYELVARKRK